MLLNELLQNVSSTIIQGDVDHSHIEYITTNSNNIKQNTLFVAIKGFTVDGHQFIDQAIENGAVAIVVEDKTEVPDHITVIQVTNTRKAISIIAANFYGQPSSKLNLIGITGTNGKTSISYMISSMLNYHGSSTGIIGTNGIIMNQKQLAINSTTPTTPEAIEINQVLNEMEKNDVSYCMMEVSSHSLALERVTGLQFTVGIFTNLTPDHLELHGTMENYFDAKSQLFQLTNNCNIINIDDPYGKMLINNLQTNETPTFTYGLNEQADYYATNIQYDFSQTLFDLNTKDESIPMTLPLPGKINLYNCLASIAALHRSGLSLESLKEAVGEISPIKGRFENVYDGDFKVIIDFAHTEDALKQLLHSIRPFAKGRIILVFGVYADMSEQGSQKRYGMGQVAAQYADFSVVTLDNPKNYDQAVILHETSDAVNTNGGEFVTIRDRKEAIEYAVNIAKENDIIVLAGKGHETAQVIGNEEIPFNEKEIALHAIQQKNN